MSLLLFLLSCALAVGLSFYHTQLRASKSTIQQLQRVNPLLASRFKSLSEVEATQQRLNRENQALAQQQKQLIDSLRQLGNAIAQIQTDLEAHHTIARLQATGYARERFSVDSPELAQRLKAIKSSRKQLIAEGKGARAQGRWITAGNEAEGRRRQEQFLNLMLLAFNGECEAVIAQVRPGSIQEAEKRVRKVFARINQLVAAQHCAITDEYLRVSLEELFITEAYRRQCKVDKEKQQEIRVRMQEELRETRALEEARERAQEKENHYAEALRWATEQVQRAVGDERQRHLRRIAELQQLLAEAQELTRRATAQAQLTRAGHVYIISNEGSFGKDVYKIGMTRRLEPQERIDELSNASVPFPFDVHAIIACDNAPMLERRLHQLFQHRRVNKANERKEFFRVPLQEIAAAVRANHGEIHFVYEAEAAQYKQSV